MYFYVGIFTTKSWFRRTPPYPVCLSLGTESRTWGEGLCAGAALEEPTSENSEGQGRNGKKSSVSDLVTAADEGPCAKVWSQVSKGLGVEQTRALRCPQCRHQGQGLLRTSLTLSVCPVQFTPWWLPPLPPCLCPRELAAGGKCADMATHLLTLAPC